MDFLKTVQLIYFITVDGRQESSSGMTLMEFADLMIEEGIYQGLNLDGGGSTTMVVNNRVVNIPSDVTGERKVGNCIVLIRETALTIEVEQIRRSKLSCPAKWASTILNIILK
ncbi:MAG: phosphodiester glycosidase family protein [Ignavibacteriales bacterium]|nr:phosphodiester glycosidase family protein [Ignavibacteriales bacterium]